MSKRIVFIHSDKGGVGKSTFARLLAAYYTDQKLPWHGFDAANRNGDFAQFYPEHITPLSLRAVGSIDQITNAVNGDHSPILVDLGTLNDDMLEEWMREISFFEMQKKAGFRTTLVFLTDPYNKSAAQWKTVTEYCGSQVDYVIVKNLALSNSVPEYDASQTPKYWQEPKAIEIALPYLWYGTYDKVIAHHIPLRDGVNSRHLFLLDRSRVFQFLYKGYAEIEKAKESFL